MNEYLKNEIKSEFESVCNAYVSLLAKNWGYDSDEFDTTHGFGWWVAGETGTVYCFMDDLFISMDDIRFCVDNDVDEETYSDYLDYNCQCSEYGFNGLNLKSYVSGAPRIKEDVFNELREKKNELERLIKETSEHY